MVDYWRGTAGTRRAANPQPLGYTAPRGRVMLTGIRHIAVPMLGLVLFVVVACEGPGSALENQFLGSPTATPDVEATVEARLNEEREKEEAIEATAEAEAQVMATAIA